MPLLERPWDWQPDSPHLPETDGGFGEGFVDGLTFAGGIPTRTGPGGATPVISGATIAGERWGFTAKLSGGAVPGSHIQIPAVNGIDGRTHIQVTGVVGSATQNGEMIWELSATADSNPGFYLYGISSTQLRLLTRSSGGGAPSSDFSLTLTADPGILTVRVDVSVAPHQIGLWYNGSQIYEGNSGAGASVGTFTQTTLNIGSRNAASLRSDGRFGDTWVHNRWMSKAELTQWHARLWEIYRPRRIWVPSSAGGGSSAPVGLATEADTALALAPVQIIATGLASETGAALALAPVQVAVAGRADETDAAQALTALQIAAVGLAVETDTALALAAVQSGAVGSAAETDEALALAAVQMLATGRADETDTALALDAFNGSSVGRADEIDTAMALAAVQIGSAGMATESSAALALSAVSSRVAGLAQEVDEAYGLTPVQIMAVGRADEVDLALPVGEAVVEPPAPAPGAIGKTGGRTRRKRNPFLRFTPAGQEQREEEAKAPAVAKPAAAPPKPTPQASGLLKALLARGLQEAAAAPRAAPQAATAVVPAQVSPVAATIQAKPPAAAVPAQAPAPDMAAMLAAMEHRLAAQLAAVPDLVEQRVATRVEQLQQRVTELEQDLALALSLVAMSDASAQVRQETRAQERKQRDLRAENERRARQLAEALLKD